MDEDETWHTGRPRPWPHCVRWRSSSPSKAAQPPIFGWCLLWPNGCMHQDTTWYRGRSQTRRNCVRWGPSSPPLMGHSPQFSANVCCGQTAGWTKMPLGTGVDLDPGHIVLDMDPAPPPSKRTQQPPPLFSAHVYCGHSRPSQLLHSRTYHTTTTILRPFFQDHTDGPVPEDNFWTLWCKGRLTEEDTLTIRLGATPTGPTSTITYLLSYYPPFHGTE